MSRQTATQTSTSDTASPSAQLLQRACACGAAASVSGKCGNCTTAEKLNLQPKLRINPPGDRWEQEADRIADAVVADPPSKAPAAPGRGPLPITPTSGGLATVSPLQRQNEDEEEEQLQTRRNPGRQAASENSLSDSGESFSRDLSSEIPLGRPLDATVRRDFEPRFGRDLSAVRIHDGARANALSRGINARAFTTGKHIFFASGALDTTSRSGRHLLAHELAHVGQQGHAPGRPGGAIRQGTIQRRKAKADAPRASQAQTPQVQTQEPSSGPTAEGFFNDLGRALTDLFTGSEQDYEESELQSYLEKIEKLGDIENDYDSDNKARAVVRKKMHKGKELKTHILLIKEMIKGFTGNDDEQAILVLLQEASKADRKTIVDNVGLETLYDNFHGDELDSLYLLFPVLGSLHPRGKKETKKHDLDDYIKKWEADHNRKMTPEEKKTLALGCIGITGLNLQSLGDPDLSNCYNSFKEAYAAKEKMESFVAQNFPDRKVLIFSKRFWKGDANYPRDKKTGKVDMSEYDYSRRPGGYTNFDYGLYDEKTGKWWHANHCDETLLNDPDCGGEMEVYESNLQYYSRGLLDFNGQVFCVGVAGGGP